MGMIWTSQADTIPKAEKGRAVLNVHDNTAGVRQLKGEQLSPTIRILAGAMLAIAVGGSVFSIASIIWSVL